MPPIPAPDPTVFVFGLGGPEEEELLEAVFGSLLKKLSHKATLKYATNTDEALDLLKGDTILKGILITDGTITAGKNDIVTEQIIEYVRIGGVTVICGRFSGSVSFDGIDRFFGQKWNLPWRYGSHHSAKLYLNTAAVGLTNADLPRSYIQKAVHLKRVPKSASWYNPAEDESIGSDDSDAVVPEFEASVIFKQVGNGWLGYVGDVNGVEGSDAVVLGMLGLS